MPMPLHPPRNVQVNFSRQIRPDMKTHLDRPLVVDPHENRNNNTNKTTANNSDLCFSQQHTADELHRQTRLHEHGGQVEGGGGGGTGPVKPPLERGESTESRRSRKAEHHHHASRVRLDATAIPGPGSEERPSRRHHHTRSGSRGGGQSEHKKPRSHRKSAEEEDGRGGAGKTGRHRSKATDGGGEGGEQEGAGDGNERRPRRSRHGNQGEGEGKRMCQHRRKYVYNCYLQQLLEILFSNLSVCRCVLIRKVYPQHLLPLLPAHIFACAHVTPRHS